MLSHLPLFWRIFVLPIFGPTVQAEATVLTTLKIVKTKETIMTFLKLLGTCRKDK